MTRTRRVGVVVLIAALCAALAGPDVFAQGFPGGGGGRGGHGMHGPPSGSKSQNPAGPMAAPDPLVVFFGTLHALRMELLVREDQVERWTAMQDALRAYAESRQDATGAPGTGADPLVRVRDLADAAQVRAEALRKVSDSLAALTAALDDRQRQTFVTRLADAFAGGGRPAP